MSGQVNSHQVPASTGTVPYMGQVPYRSVNNVQDHVASAKEEAR